MCAEIAGEDIHLGDSRLSTCKNLLSFDVVSYNLDLSFYGMSLEVSNVNYDRRDSRC